MSIKSLSWSELYSFEKYPDDWYAQYIEGKEKPPNNAMVLGNIAHSAIEKSLYRYDKELEAVGMEDKIPIVAAIVSKISRVKLDSPEHFMRAKTRTGIGLYGFLDDFDSKNLILNEYKTSDIDEKWTQHIVDNHAQLNFYAYMLYLKRRKYFKEINLYFCHTGRGTVKKFTTARGPRDIHYIAQRIEAAVSKMKQKNLWELRLTREARIKKATPQLFEITEKVS